MKIIKVLDSLDIANMAQAIEYRRLNFNEDPMMSLGVVLMNYGDRYVKVICVNNEWSGVKGDLERRDGIPLCPNGHPLFETTIAPRLVLVGDDTMDWNAEWDGMDVD